MSVMCLRTDSRRGSPWCHEARRASSMPRILIVDAPRQASRSMFDPHLTARSRSRCGNASSFWPASFMRSYRQPADELARGSSPPLRWAAEQLPRLDSISMAAITRYSAAS
jgi:hypothetical protein